MQLWLAVVLAAGVLTAPTGVLSPSPTVTSAGAVTSAGFGSPPGTVTEPGAVAGRQADFAAAAREYGVPESLLLAVAYLESRWDANGGRPSTAGGYGPMHLVDAFPGDVRTHGHAAAPGEPAIGDALGDPRGDDARPMSPALAEALSRSALRTSAEPPPRTTLPEAGRLIGVEPDRLRADPAANIRAGAALLASYQERPSADPADWHAAVARYAGTDDPVASRAFADEVFAVMREGAQRRTDDGHLVRLDPVPGLPATGTPPGTATSPTGQAPAPAPAGTAPAGTADTGTAGTGTAGTGTADAGTAGTAAPSGQEPGSAAAPADRQPGGSAPANPQPATSTGATTGTGIAPATGTGTILSPGTAPNIGSGGSASGGRGAGDDPAGGMDGWPEGGLVDGVDVDALWDNGMNGMNGPKGQASTSSQVECPSSLTCEWMPAAYKRFGKKKDRDYGNHDHLSRKREVDYIVIHDTEGTYQGIPSLIRNPKYVSWHYTIRSRDGHVAQHVPTNDIAWHAGNWDINTRSIGIEHEGYLAKGGAWYTEAMYRSSARLVKYLAAKHHIPLNRAHILGHDNVPGTSPQTVAGMHEDPGPYWDWEHYFELMGRPFRPVKNGDSVIIRPSYAANRPHFTGCVPAKAAQACPAHGASTVWLHKAPSQTAPLVTDLGKHPGKPSTYSVYDHSARASTGQRFAVAARQGDWTAIWYLGQKAWFHNPASNPTAIPAKGPMVTPLSGEVKVYGRAYPEKAAYKRAAYQPLTPLKYRIGPGQTYTVGDTVTGSYYAANAFSPAKHVTTTGRIRYHQIQLGHRVMFVMAKDVRLIG
ncbi:N-acetylmuramoyl-L-alanine amidase [[Actinomadura] parvosata]|uniref:N-acetylmuramoyl-L-alanine amidase n=1 Tax=[Actinomadura] parvosata TaxID=1955412 RepID=UPI00406CE354